MWHIPSIEKYRFCVESPDGLEEIPFPLSTARILERADELGVRWRAIPYTHLIELQYCNETHVFHYQIPSSTTELGFYACLDKGVSQSLLRQAGLSVASGFKVLPAHTTKQMRKCFDQLQKPLVVKPSHGYQGRGVFMHIMTFEEMVAAIMSHRSLPLNEDEGSMVEETLQGKEHRLVVSRDRFIAATFRRPANVIGDGKHNIQELLDEKNSDPRRGDTLQFALFHIHMTDQDTAFLAEQQHSLSSVPQDGERVFLKRVSNISQGGESVDITDSIHDSVKEIALKAIQAIPGLGFAGVDFITTDITQPQQPGQHGIVEINSSPGICIQEYPFEGTPRDASGAFLQSMFPSLHIG